MGTNHRGSANLVLAEAAIAFHLVLQPEWSPFLHSHRCWHQKPDDQKADAEVTEKKCILEMPYLVHLLSSSESMDMNSSASLDFGSTCSNPSINLKYSGPSLSISASACLMNVSTVLVSVFC